MQEKNLPKIILVILKLYCLKLYHHIYLLKISHLLILLLFLKSLWFDDTYRVESGTWPASWEICMQVRKQQLELDMEQQAGSK